MQDSRTPELIGRLNEYIEAEMTSRKKAGDGKIMLSKLDFTAVMRIYGCAEKGSPSFDGLFITNDEDLAQSLNFVAKVLGIKDFSDVSEFAGKVRNYAGLLSKLEREGKSALTDDEFTVLADLKNLRGKEARYILTAVISLFCESCSDDFTPKAMLSEYIAIAHPRHVKPLYEILLLTLGSKQSDSAATEDTEFSREISALMKQNDTLRAELESAYIRLNTCEENYDILQNEGREAAISEVLTLMNSPESKMLIDQFARCEQVLKDAAEKGVELPEEYSSLPVCIKIFMNTMRKVFGVKPLLKTGEILEINLDQATRYKYSGSLFENADELKKVEVISPGWSRNDEVFSPPHVMECH